MKKKHQTSKRRTPVAVGSDALVRLLCRKCGAETMIKREPYEPASVATVTCVCPKCDNGGFDDLQYLDANGRDIGDIFEKPNTPVCHAETKPQPKPRTP